MTWHDITSDTPWQSLKIATQLIDQYNQRIAILTPWQQNYFKVEELPNPDQDTKVFDIIHAIQKGIDAIHPLFADPTQPILITPDTPTNTQAQPPAIYATLSDLHQAAHLDQPGGWRRIPEYTRPPTDWTDYDDPRYSYGPIQSNDLAGPWLLKDLQQALDSLTRLCVAFLPSFPLTRPTDRFTGYTGTQPLNGGFNVTPQPPLTIPTLPNGYDTPISSYNNTSLIMLHLSTNSSTTYDVWYASVLNQLQLLHLTTVPHTIHILSDCCIPYTTSTGWAGSPLTTDWPLSDTPRLHLISTTSDSTDPTYTYIELPIQPTFPLFSHLLTYMPYPPPPSPPASYHFVSISPQSSSRYALIDYDFSPPAPATP